MIDRIRGGDRTAFRELVHHFSRHVYHVTYSVLHDEKEAEDAAQEVFVQVYVSLSQYRDEGFKTWLTRIAVRKAIDTKRKRNRRPAELMDPLEGWDQLLTDDEDILATVLQKERTAEFAARIAALPQQHKEIITAFYIEGKSYEQMAKEMQVATKTIESRLYRARQWIRANWTEEEWA